MSVLNKNEIMKMCEIKVYLTLLRANIALTQYFIYDIFPIIYIIELYVLTLFNYKSLLGNFMKNSIVSSLTI